MRQIDKNPVEPPEFTAWKALANQNWLPNWGNFQRPEKQIVHRALLQEQGYLCCYCGRRIEAAVAEDSTVDPIESHIEHFKPRERYASRSLCYWNLLASCLKERARGAQLHCGAAKDKWYDANTVSPLKDGVEARFVYDAEGHIRAADGDTGAQATIEHLNLEKDEKTNNLSPLVEWRRKAIEEALFEESYKELAPTIRVPVQTLKSQDAIQAELTRVRTRDAHNRFPSFAQAIEAVGRGMV